MNISPKQRFLDICHFKRPGDLYIRDGFWPETLENWVKQGASKQLLADKHFVDNYFQFDRWHSLTQVISGIVSSRANQPSIPGYEIRRYERTPVVPGYEPRIVAEDEHTITFINGDGNTLKVLKDNPDRMPLVLACPFKDRTTWN